MLRIGYKPGFLRQFKQLPPKLQQEASLRIALFSKDPRHSSLRVHKLKGALKGTLSFSVNFSYRIVFFFQDKKTAIVLAIGNHDVYQ